MLKHEWLRETSEKLNDVNREIVHDIKKRKLIKLLKCVAKNPQWLKEQGTCYSILQRKTKDFLKCGKEDMDFPFVEKIMHFREQMSYSLYCHSLTMKGTRCLNYSKSIFCKQHHQRRKRILKIISKHVNILCIIGIILDFDCLYH